MLPISHVTEVNACILNHLQGRPVGNSGHGDYDYGYWPRLAISARNGRASRYVDDRSPLMVTFEDLAQCVPLLHKLVSVSTQKALR